MPAAYVEVTMPHPATTQGKKMIKHSYGNSQRKIIGHNHLRDFHSPELFQNYIELLLIISITVAYQILNHYPKLKLKFTGQS